MYIRNMAGVGTLKITFVATILVLTNSLALGAPKNEYDFTGFWKSDCNNPYGVQIRPFKDGLYTIDFCGPGGGCDEPQEERHATPILGDPSYEVISETEIHEKINGKVYSKIYKCTSDTNPELKYSDEAIAKKNADNPFISCEGTPEEAEFLISEPQIKKWAQVVCSKYGHAIVPTEGYVWSYYGGLAPIALMAQKIGKEKAPEEVGNSVYFVEIEARKLNSKDAKEISKKASFGDSYPPEPEPDVYLLSSTSSTKVTQKIYFLLYEDRLSGAIPYPNWIDNYDGRELIPFFIFDGRKTE